MDHCRSVRLSLRFRPCRAGRVLFRHNSKSNRSLGVESEARRAKRDLSSLPASGWAVTSVPRRPTRPTVPDRRRFSAGANRPMCHSDDAKRFLADEAANGFNTVWVNLLCNRYTGGRSDGTTYDKIAPFWISGDLSTPNEAYFPTCRRCDPSGSQASESRLSSTQSRPAGWLDVLMKNDVGKDYAYGKWLGNRFKKFPNIVWFNGNDFQQWRDPAANPAGVCGGAKASERLTHATSTPSSSIGPTSGSRDSHLWAPIIGLNAAYTYYATYAPGAQGIQQTGFHPSLHGRSEL